MKQNFAFRSPHNSARINQKSPKNESNKYLEPSRFPMKAVTDFYNLPFSDDKRTLRAALVSVVISFFRESVGMVGFITEQQSLMLLLQSKVNELVAAYGVSFVEFRAIHALVYMALAFGRVRISIDAYIDFFLPRITLKLQEAIKCASFDANKIYAAIIYPIWERNDLCGIREKLVCNSILLNREMFAKFVRLE
ncbi:unnamed protein product [Calicophoron daubneyi]|uniref:Uncharacterized protein n=1 Tax=Calicophoron daubneyi TaxID=300641 RepID=A0AAV2TRW4_CALDB